MNYIVIAVLGFALTALWSSLHSIILPVRILDFVSESQKNSWLGLLTFVGLLLAIVVQPIMGNLSDRSPFRWGKRRPFILIGVVLTILFLPGIGVANSVIFVFFTYCLLQISGNTAQGAYQAFIPDIVPLERRGRASGAKSILELLGGIVLVRLVAVFMDNYFTGEGTHWMWLALGSLAGLLLVMMSVTLYAIKEQPDSGSSRGKISVSYVLESYKVDTHIGRGFIFFLLVRGLMSIPGVMLQLFGLYFIMDYLKLDEPVRVFGDLLVVVGISLLISAYPAGRMADRIGRKPVIIFSCVFGISGIISLLFSSGYVHLMVSGAVLGIANGAFMSGTWAMATDLAAGGEEARYMALTNVATAGGSALARLAGPVIDFFNTGMGQGEGYRVMLYICLVCFTVGLVLIVRMKPFNVR